MRNIEPERLGEQTCQAAAIKENILTFSHTKPPRERATKNIGRDDCLSSVKVLSCPFTQLTVSVLSRRLASD
jgi:hypothetical protein